MQQVHFLVSGRVQGVGYRAFVERQALALGISGQVRNLHDGRVELIAKGTEEQISDLKDRLLKGPRLAQVLAVEAKTIAGARHFEGFCIEEDGKLPWYGS